MAIRNPKREELQRLESKTLLQTLDYCHKNPLTRALVDRA